jgi:small nuclear ribonucleoprotein (snRNP)-like protein
VTGTLKGYDQLMNLVLDNVSEVTRGMLRKSVLSLDDSNPLHP